MQENANTIPPVTPSPVMGKEMSARKTFRWGAVSFFPNSAGRGIVSRGISSIRRPFLRKINLRTNYFREMRRFESFSN